MKKNLQSTTAKRLKELRLAHGYTMEKLAEKIGVSKSTIAKWENGYVDNMRQKMITKLSELYQVSGAYIIGLDDSMKTVEIKNDNPDSQFIELYNRLEPYQKGIVQNMIVALSEKK